MTVGHDFVVAAVGRYALRCDGDTQPQASN